MSQQCHDQNGRSYLTLGQPSRYVKRAAPNVLVSESHPHSSWELHSLQRSTFSPTTMKCQALSVVLACTVQAVWANPPPAYGNAPSPPTYGSKPPQYGSSPPQPYGVCKEYYSLIYYPPAQAFCQNNYPKPRQTSTVVTTSTVTVSQPYQGPPSYGPPGHGPPTPPSHGPPFAGPPAVCNAKREADPEVEPVAEAEAHLMNLRKRHYDLAKDFCDKCIKPKPPGELF